MFWGYLYGSTLHLMIIVPSGMQAPEAITTIENDIPTVSLTWELPLYPNGSIISYSLLKNSQLLRSGDATFTTYLDDSVLPGQIVEYIVRASTAAGSSASPAEFVIVPDGSPAGMMPPEVSIKSRISS